MGTGKHRKILRVAKRLSIFSRSVEIPPLVADISPRALGQWAVARAQRSLLKNGERIMMAKLG